MITLDIGEARAVFRTDAGPASTELALGPRELVARWLRHDPPTGAELEQAIEAVEERVMPLHRRLPADADLRITGSAAAIETLAALAGTELSRDTLETLFDRAAAVAQGRPRTSDPLLAQPETMALVLVLREVMHHLGFTRLRFAPR